MAEHLIPDGALSTVASLEAAAWDEAAAIALTAQIAGRQLRMLQELAEIGMSLARALERGVQEVSEFPREFFLSAPGVSARADPADAFARIARGVRLTLALESRIAADLAAGPAALARRILERRAAAETAALQADDARHAAHGRLGSAARRLAEGDAALAHDEEAERDEDLEPAQIVRRDLAGALRETLTEHEAWAGRLDRPAEEILDRICRDFGLNPDWRRRFGRSELETCRKPWDPGMFTGPKDDPAGADGEDDGDDAAPPPAARPAGRRPATPAPGTDTARQTGPP
jgi:hypothetical protein